MPAESDARGAPTRYVLDNTAQEARRRLAGLADVFDPGTFRLLAERGVAAGWRCLEVGAGGGSVATWLADRVGPSGYVLATDIEPQFSDQRHRPQLDVRRHDATVDAFPPETFDLVHARLVLLHLPSRDAVLAHMANALNSGGWLLIEDFDVKAVSAEPTLDDAEAVLKSREAMLRAMEDKGIDLRYGRRIAARMRALGLVDIGAEARAFRWQGGSAGAGIDGANLRQMRAAILASGLVSETEFEADVARLDDPEFAYPSPVLWATWGRKAQSPKK